MSIFIFKFTEAEVEQYAELSGDRNPIHLNIEAAKDQGFSRRVVHGNLTMAKIESLLITAYFSEGKRPSNYICTFNSPVYIGVEVTLTVTKQAEKFLFVGKCCATGIVIKGMIS